MAEFKLLATYLLAIAAVAALASCDGDDRGMRTTSRADRDGITVSVRWVSPERIDGVCKSMGTKDGQTFNACAMSGPTACTIYAVQPRSFADKSALQTLGHEAWHCFGARHN